MTRLTMPRNRTSVSAGVENDLRVYQLALKFLHGLKTPGLTRSVLESYLASSGPSRPETMRGIYLQLVESTQNANMKAGVIGGSIGGVKNLAPVLCDFEPAEVHVRFGDDSSRLLDLVVKQLKPKGKIRKTSRSLWPQFCRSVLSGAKFLTQFGSASEFYAWLDVLAGDPRSRAALPLILSEEVRGLGFALACDFLMGLGYTTYGKPDVHIRDIFTAAGLCSKGARDFEILKAICRVADAASVTPHTVDQLFWLVGSGYFYKHPEIGDRGRIPRPKKAFLELLA